MIVQNEDRIARPPQAATTFQAAVPQSAGRAITKLVLIGSRSDCAKKKILPGLQHLTRHFEKVCLVDIAAESGENSIKHQYLRAGPGNHLDLDYLRQHGFLDWGTLTYISSPTDSHAAYIAKMAPYTRVGCEKMPAKVAADALPLRKLQLPGRQIFTADHKIFNKSALDTIDAIRRNPGMLESVRRIEGVMFEAAGYVKDRGQVDWAGDDTGWHLMAIVQGVFRAVGESANISVEESLSATHLPDPDEHYLVPKLPTAARIRGFVDRGGFLPGVELDIRCAKASGTNEKWMRLLDVDNRVIATIDLNETGWAAHQRMLEELIKPEPDMRLTFEDSIDLTRVTDTARTTAEDRGYHPFGKLPSFMTD